MALSDNKKMTGKQKASLAAIFLLALATAGAILLYGANFEVLNPKGPVAQRQRDLIVWASLLSLIVVIPVFALTFGIAWKYRAGNKKARYAPDWDGSRLLETIWWGIPLLLIIILSVVIYSSSHELDPAKPLAAGKKPITIQVIALQWKWLFIYPEQKIASVNYLQFPEDTPINFVITADAPMNSFWIPQLGGQIYAMAGMSTRLHLMADEPGEYKGSSANISGRGFAGMKFIAQAASQNDFYGWVQSVKGSPLLDQKKYDGLARPSEDMPPAQYSVSDAKLYDTVIMKYTGPGNSMHAHGMNHGGGY